MSGEPIHEDEAQDESGSLVGHVGRSPVLNTLHDKNRVAVMMIS